MRNLCKVQARDRQAGDTHWDSQTHVASPSQGPSGISSACRDGGRLRVAASHLIWLRISRPSLNHLPLGYCCFALCTVVFFFPVQNTLMSGGGLPRDPLEDPRYRTEAGTWMPLNWGPVSRPGLPHQAKASGPTFFPSPPWMAEKAEPSTPSPAGKGRGETSSWSLDRSALGTMQWGTEYMMC